MRARSAALVVVLLAILVPRPAGASDYGTGRFRTVQVRYEAPGITVAVEGYLAEGSRVALDVGDPHSTYLVRYVCAFVYTPAGRDSGCGDGQVAIAWPLLEVATLRATMGTISVDLTVVERGTARLSPLAQLGFPIPFAHTGVVVFRPGTATGTVSSSVGSVTGVSNQAEMYSLTSVYGVPF